jgi:hypothetical protein
MLPSVETNGFGHQGWTKGQYAVVGWFGVDVCSIRSACAFDVVRIQLGCKLLHVLAGCSVIARH